MDDSKRASVTARAYDVLGRHETTSKGYLVVVENGDEKKNERGEMKTKERKGGDTKLA